jgi:hypothetical protein
MQLRGAFFLSGFSSRATIECIAIISSDEVRLQPGFTFRIVEAIKQTKIQAPPSKMTLPFGVSAAAGLIVLLLSLSVLYSPLYRIGQLIGSALPSQMRVPEDGIIPVENIEIREIIRLSPEMNDGDFGKEPQLEPKQMFGGGKWSEKADMPKGRAFLSGTVLDGEIYAVGGFGDFPQMVGTVEAYNPKTDAWSKKANMPTPRSGLVVVALNGKLYAIGGSISQQHSSFCWTGSSSPTYTMKRSQKTYDRRFRRTASHSRKSEPAMGRMEGHRHGKTPGIRCQRSGRWIQSLQRRFTCTGRSL